MTALKSEESDAAARIPAERRGNGGGCITREAKKETGQGRRAGYASKRKREIWGSEDGPDGILIRVPHDSCLCCAMLRHILSLSPLSLLSLSLCLLLLCRAHLISPPSVYLSLSLAEPTKRMYDGIPNRVYLRYCRGGCRSFKPCTCARKLFDKKE